MIKIFMGLNFEFMSVGVVLDIVINLVRDQVPDLRCGNALWILLLSKCEVLVPVWYLVFYTV